MTSELAETPEASLHLKNPAIILVEPQLGENIGTAARAMANFGLRELRIVNPRDSWPNEKAQKASANAIEVIETAKIYPDFESAVSDLSYICATTARPREMVKPVLSPESAAKHMHSIYKEGEKTGIVFGREKSGLTNTDISYCDSIVIAPVDPSCASLNLAQAVLLMGYEWRKHYSSSIQPELTLGRQTEFDGPAQEGVTLKTSRSATKQEMSGLYNHLESELVASGFLRTVEKTPQMMRNIRNMLIRMQPTDQDVRTLRGIISSLVKGPHRSGNGK